MSFSERQNFRLSGAALRSVALGALALALLPSCRVGGNLLNEDETAINSNMTMQGSSLIVAGACEPLSIAMKTPSHENAPVGASVGVALSVYASAGVPGGIYSDSACTDAINALVVPAGSSSSTIYVRNTKVQELEITATASEYNSSVIRVRVVPAAASRLNFLRQASTSALAGVAFPIQPELSVEDAFGNILTNASNAVTLAAFSDTACSVAGTGTLSAASTSVPASAGIADFAGVKYTKTGALHLQATSPGLASACSDAIAIAPVTPDHLTVVVEPTTTMAGASISPSIQVELRDSFENVASLSSLPVTLAFGTNAGGGSLSGTLTVTAASGVATFPGISIDKIGAGYTLSFSASGLVSATSAAFAITPAPASQLAFTSAAQTAVVAGQCSAAATFQTRDPYGNASGVASASTVSIAGPANVTYYSDAACTNAIPSVSLPIGTSDGTFYFKSDVTGSKALTISSAGLSSANQTEIVIPAPPSKLAFLSSSQTLTAGACSGAATVEIQDTFSNSRTAIANTVVTPSGASMTFYSDAACASAIPDFTIATGSSSGTFYFKGTLSGTIALGAAASGLTSATQNETINPAAPAQLTLGTPAQNVTAGSCSAVLTVNSKDSYGNLSAPGSNTTVAIARVGVGLSFFSDSGCSSAVTDLTIAGGSSAGSLYFKGTAAGTADLTFSTAGLTDATQTETILAAAPAKLAIVTSAQTVTAGVCSGIATAQSQDSYSNPSDVSSSTTVSLSAPSTTFFSDAGCTTSVTSVSISSGTNSKSFYFRRTLVGTATVSATAGGLTAASQDETIVPAAPAKLAYTSGAQTVVAGTCSAATAFIVRDSFDNTSPVTSDTTVTISGASGAFYSDSGCATPITDVAVLTGASTGSFYFSRTLSGTLPLGVAATGLTSASQNQTINPAAAVALEFTVQPANRTAGLSLTPSVQVSLKDTYGNVASLSSATVAVALDSNPGAATLNGTLSQSTSSGVATFANLSLNVAATGYSLAASSGGLTGATSSAFDITPAAASKLVFVSSSQTLIAGACSGAITIQTQDPFSNVSNVASNTPVTLSGTGLSFFSDSSCTTSIPNLSIASGTSSGTAYFTGTVAGVQALAASAGGLTGASQNQTINPGPPAKIAFISAIQNLEAGACSAAVTVQSRDSYNNASPVTADEAVALSASHGAIYSDASCSSSTASITIGNGTTNQSFYYRDTLAGTHVMTGTPATLTASSQNINVAAAPPAKVVFAQQPGNTVAGVTISPSVTVEVKDAYDNVVTTSTGKVNIAIGNNAGGGTLSGASFVFAVAGVATFNAHSINKIGTGYTLSATALGLAGDTSAAFDILPAPPAKLAFTTGAQNRDAGQCSGILSVITRDSFDNLAPVPANRIVTFSDSVGTGTTFHLASDCSDAAVTQSTITTGNTQADFYFKMTKSGSHTVTAASTNPSLISATTQVETINPLPPVKLAYSTSPVTTTAGACSGVMTVQSQDGYGNPSNVAGNTQVDFALSGVYAASMTLYSNNTCSTPLATAPIRTQISAGTNAASFYAKSNFPGTVDIQASDNAAALTLTTQTETVVPAPANKIIFTSAPYTRTAGDCSGAVDIALRDPYDNVTYAGSNITVTLAGTGMAFFSDSSCSTSIPGAAIPNGGSASTFYYRGTTAGTITLTASYTGLTSGTQDQTINAAALNRIGFGSTAQTLVAGVCSAATVAQLQDQYGNPQVDAGANRTIDISGNGAGYAFYSDAACTGGNELTQVTINQNTTDAPAFHFKRTQSGTLTVGLATAGLASGSQNETINPDAGVSIAFAQQPTDTLAGASFSPNVSVELKDQYGNRATSTTKTVSLGFAANPTSTTLQGTTSVATPGGTGLATFSTISIQAASAGYQLRASVTGWSDVDSNAFAITPAAPNKLAYLSLPASITAGACSAASVVEVRDTYNNPSDVGANTTVNLSGTGITFYSDAGCTSSITSVSVASGTHAATFYFVPTTSGLIAVGASAGGLTGASQNLTVNPAVASKLAYQNSPLTLTAGVCSAAITAQSKDAYNNTSAVTSDTTVTISQSGSLATFYSDASCTNAITQFTISNGGSSSQFYARSSQPGSLVVTVEAVAVLAAANQTETVISAAPSKLAFTTGSQNLVAGACSAAVVVETQDSFSNPSQVGSNTSVSLTSPGLGFYGDSSCTSSITNVTIGTGTSSATYYVRGTTVGTYASNAAAGGLTGTSQNHTITFAAADRLAFQAQPSHTVAGQVISPAITVLVKDAFGNTITTATPTIAIALGANPGSDTLQGTLSEAAVAGSATFNTLKLEKMGTAYTLVASTAGLTSGTSASFNITPAAATQYLLTSAPQNLQVGNCSDVVELQAFDTYLNPSALPSNTIVSLSGPDLNFYSDSSCVNAITDVTILSGSSQSQFYFKSIVTGIKALLASDGTLTDATQNETITPGVPTRLAYTTAAQNLTSGQCSAVLGVEIQDNYSNASPPAGNTLVNLFTPNMTFYSDAACSAPISNVTVPAGQSALSFYVMPTLAGSQPITVSASGLVSATQYENVGANTASRLVFTSQPETLNIDTCSAAMTFVTQDLNGNATPLSADKTFNLTTAAGAQLYSDSGCTSAIPTLTLSSGTGSGSFFFKSTRSGGVPVDIGAAGFTTGTIVHFVNPGPATQLAFTSASQSLLANDCSAPVVIESRDGYANPSPVSGNVVLNLSAPNVTFYSNSTCTNVITSSTIPDTGTSTSFYFKTTVAGTFTLTAASGGALGTITQNESVAPAAPAILAILTAEQTIVAGSCSSVLQIVERDLYGNDSPAPADTQIELTSSAVVFYSDSGCTNPIANTTILSGQTGTSVYFSGTVALDDFIVASSFTGLTNAGQYAHVIPKPPAKLLVAGTSQSLKAGDCSTGIEVIAVDEYGNESPPASPLPLDISSPNGAAQTGLTLRVNPNVMNPCGVPAVPTIPAGQSRLTYFFNETLATPLTLDHTFGGAIASVSTSHTITPNSLHHVTFETPSYTVNGGACSPILTVVYRDAYENETYVHGGTAGNGTFAPQPFYLGPAYASFFDDSNCAVPMAGSTWGAPQNSTRRDLFFKSSVEGDMTINVYFSPPGGSPPSVGNQTHTILAGAPSRIAFTTPARRLPFGTCSQNITVQSQSQQGSPSNVDADTTVELYSARGSKFYSDNSCTNEITQVTISSGSSSAQFYFVPTQTAATNGTELITTLAQDFTTFSQAQNVLKAASNVWNLAESSPGVWAPIVRKTFINRCTSHSLDWYDQGGTRLSGPMGSYYPQGATLTFGASDSTQFFSDASCTTPAPSINYSCSGDATNGYTCTASAVYTKSPDAGTPTLTATEPAFAAAATTTMNVYDKKLTIASGPGTLTAGNCSSAFTVEAQDVNSNPINVPANVTVNLATWTKPPTYNDPGTRALTFFSDAACTNAVTTATIAAGSSSQTFYARVNTIGYSYIYVSTNDNYADDVSNIINIVPNVASVIELSPHPALTSAPGFVQQDQCSAYVTLYTRDAYGNISAVASPTAFNLSADQGPITFYTDSTCSTVATSDQLTLNGGQNFVNFYFKTSFGGNFTLTVSSAGFTPNSFTTGSANSKMAFTSAPVTSEVHQCSAITVQAQELDGTPKNVTSNMGVTFWGGPHVYFSANADCSASDWGDHPTGSCTGSCKKGPTFTMASGTNSLTVYMKGNRVYSPGINAIGYLHVPAYQVETFTTPTSPRIQVGQNLNTAAGQSVVAGSCSGLYTTYDPLGNITYGPYFYVTDSSGNLFYPASGTQFNLSGTGYEFFSDSTCQTQTSTLTWSYASGAPSVQRYYFKHTLAGDQSLDVQSAGYASASATHTVRAGIVSQVGFGTAPQTVTAGACSSALGVQLQDQYGNANFKAQNKTVALFADTGTLFFSDAACSTSIATTTITAGQTTRNIYFKRNQAGTISITPAIFKLDSVAQSETINPDSTTKIGFTTNAQTLNAGTCSSMTTIQLQDQFSNGTPAAANTAVNLGGAGMSFFSDDACSTSITSVTVAQSANSASFYFKPQQSGDITLTASSAGLTDGTQVERVNPAAPTQLGFTQSPVTAIAGSCSSAVLVSTLDAFNNPTNVLANTTVNVSAPGATIYSDPACSTAAPSVVIASASNSQVFYFRTTTAGSLTVTASSTGLTNGTQTETVQAAIATGLDFSTAPQSVQAGGCSAVATVRLVDQYANTSTASSTQTINVSGPSLTIYSDPGCSSTITNVSIGAGASSANLYFRSNAAGTRTITASKSGIASGSQAETITAAAPATLAFSSAPKIFGAGACSTAVTVSSRDSFGNVSAVGSDTQVDLAGTGFGFYSDASCTTPITSVTISSGASSAQFRISGTLSGTRQITVSTLAGLSSANQNETINAGTPAQIGFSTAPQTIVVDNCSNITTVQTQDSYGNASNSASNVTVALSSGGGTGFYSDSACTVAITQVQINAGSQSSSFFFKSASFGSVALTATPSGLTAASQNETISAGPPVKLAFANAAYGSLVAGTCAALTIETQDSYGNPSDTAAAKTVSLTSSGSPASFFSDASCSTSVSSVTIGAGTHQASAWFRATATGNSNLSATTAGLTYAPQTETIVPAAPVKFAFATAPLAVTAGVCSSMLTVQSQDTYSNPSPLAGPTTVNLSGTDYVFHSDSGCSSPVTSVSIAGGASSASFYLQATVSGSRAISAGDGSLTDASQTETVNPATAVKLAFATAPLNVNAGSCSAITLQSRDTYDNASNVAAPVSLGYTLTGTPAGLYSDAGCSSSIAGSTLSAGTSAVTVYFRSTQSGSTILDADAGGALAAASQTETIQPNPASTLAFLSAPHSIGVGSCSGTVSFQSQDSLGNASDVTSTTTVTPSGPGMSFFSDAGCSSPIATVTIASGTSGGSLYFSGTVSGSVSLTLTASSGMALSSASQAQALAPGAAVQLGFGNAPLNVAVASCTALSVQTQDSYGNAVDRGSASTVAFAISGNPAVIYSDSSCLNAIGSVGVAAGTTGTTVYYRSTTTGSSTVTLSTAGLSDGAQTETVVPLTPTQLVFTSTAQTIAAGSCSAALTIQSQDSFNNAAPVGSNTTVTLSGASTTFYSDAGCSSAVGSVSIASGQNQATAYFKRNISGSMTLTASAGGLTSGTQNQTIQPAAASKLVILTAPQTLTAGDCSAGVLLEVRDAYDNLVPQGAPLSINLSGGSLQFFSDSSCSTSLGGVGSISGGASSTTFYFKDNTAEAVTLTAASGALTAATQAQTINAGTPTQLGFLAPATTMASGSCSLAFTVQSQDTLGNASAVGSNTTVTLSNTGSGAFYSDLGCVTPITTRVITNGTHSQSFYFKDAVAESTTLTGQTGLLSDATRALTIQATGPIIVMTDGTGTTISSYDYGVWTVDVSRSFKIKNIGTSASGTLSLAATSPTPSMWSVTSDGCTGQTLAAGATCDITMLFKAGSGGMPAGDYYYATFEAQAAALGANDGGGTVTLPLQGIKQ